MKANITKEQIIAYLYGEMESEERELVKQHLESHPEDAAEVSELMNLRRNLQSVPDIKVGHPPVMFLNRKYSASKRTFRNVKVWRNAAAVAAVIVVVLLMGKIMGLQIEKQPSGFAIYFGEPEATEENVSREEYLNSTLASISEMDSISQDLVASNNHLQKKVKGLEKDLGELVEYARTLKSKNNKGGVSEEKLAQMLDEFSAQNLLLLNNILETSNKSQQQYINKMFADYAGFLEEQREQDLQTINFSLKTVQNQTEISNAETQEIIARLMQKVSDKDN